VIKADLGPIIQIVAIGTLANIVIVTIGWDVARSTIDKAAVVKGYVGPVMGIVTVGTLAVIVVCRWCMARLAIDKTFVIKVNVTPIVGIVTSRTLKVIMVWWCIDGVAGLAVTVRAMILDIAPIAGAVTIGALAIIVVRWCIAGMARYTIRKTLVGKGYLSPVVRVVAGRAVTIIVVRR
jgi:hypothetical protein